MKNRMCKRAFRFRNDCLFVEFVTAVGFVGTEMTRTDKSWRVLFTKGALRLVVKLWSLAFSPVWTYLDKSSNCVYNDRSAVWEQIPLELLNDNFSLTPVSVTSWLLDFPDWSLIPTAYSFLTVCIFTKRVAYLTLPSLQQFWNLWTCQWGNTFSPIPPEKKTT